MNKQQGAANKEYFGNLAALKEKIMNQTSTQNPNSNSRTPPPARFNYENPSPQGGGGGGGGGIGVQKISNSGQDTTNNISDQQSKDLFGKTFGRHNNAPLLAAMRLSKEQVEENQRYLNRDMEEEDEREEDDDEDEDENISRSSHIRNKTNTSTSSNIKSSNPILVKEPSTDLMRETSKFGQPLIEQQQKQQQPQKQQSANRSSFKKQTPPPPPAQPSPKPLQQSISAKSFKSAISYERPPSIGSASDHPSARGSKKQLDQQKPNPQMRQSGKQIPFPPSQNSAIRTSSQLKSDKSTNNQNVYPTRVIPAKMQPVMSAQQDRMQLQQQAQKNVYEQQYQQQMQLQREKSVSRSVDGPLVNPSRSLSRNPSNGGQQNPLKASFGVNQLQQQQQYYQINQQKPAANSRNDASMKGQSFKSSINPNNASKRPQSGHQPSNQGIGSPVKAYNWRPQTTNTVAISQSRPVSAQQQKQQTLSRPYSAIQPSVAATKQPVDAYQLRTSMKQATNNAMRTSMQRHQQQQVQKGKQQNSAQAMKPASIFTSSIVPMRNQIISRPSNNSKANGK